MSQYQPVLEALNTEPYETKKQLLEYLVNMLQRTKHIPNEDRAAIMDYAQKETDSLLTALKTAETPKEKDLLCACEDLLLGLVMTLHPTADTVPEELMAKLQLLIALVANEQTFENMLNKLFEQDSIHEAETAALLNEAKNFDDEYRKGKLYLGLIHYREQVNKLTPQAQALIAEYIVSELERYVSCSPLIEDQRNALELAVDICKDYPCASTVPALEKTFSLGHGSINYYAAESILSLGSNIPERIAVSLAKDLEYANLAYGLLSRHGKAAMFPSECTTEEYLAKSDMVHWLTYPTELGSVPDEIEYIGKVSYLLKKEVFHVFKYRSASDTLSDDLKNQWLIGWSSQDGGTFSNFDKFSDFDKGTPAATLKAIKKQLIG